MERKISKELSAWKAKPDRKPLMVLGCRQIGKTYSIREFLRSNYDSYLEINLEREPDKCLIFKDDLSAETIIDKLIMVSDKELTPGRSAIFLDEIQSCKGAYSSLKWLAEDRRFDIVVSGSFLGINLKGSGDRDASGRGEPISPLGYVETIMMYPMDFEEYLWAAGVRQEVIDHAKDAIRNTERIDDAYNRMLTEHFRRYLVVGGMPEAVKVYTETKDYAKARATIEDIISVLRADVGKYSNRKTDRMKILACLESIPSQLASDNRKFQYKDIEKSSGRASMYGDALEWLVTAGMAYRCYNLRNIDPPLSMNLKEKAFKLYLCDNGLLMGLMDFADVGAIVTVDPFSNNGIVMENAVATALAKKGYPLYYYAKDNSTLEIDFVANTGKVELIEVKSGRNKRSKSLNTLLAEKDRKRMGIKICDGNVEVDDNGAIHLPLYGACFLPEPEIPDISFPDVN